MIDLRFDKWKWSDKDKNGSQINECEKKMNQQYKRCRAENESWSNDNVHNGRQPSIGLQLDVVVLEVLGPEVFGFALFDDSEFQVDVGDQLWAEVSLFGLLYPLLSVLHLWF